MFKKSSIAAIQQQLTQLEILGNDQLNGLLKRLKSYKSELPIEDRPIIDWGINLIRAKIREKEQLMNEAWEEMKRKYHNYDVFIQSSGWRELDLSNREGKQSLSTSTLKYLDNIIAKSCLNKDQLILKEFIPTVREHIYKFCDEKGDREFAEILITKYVDFYKERAVESNQKNLSSGEEGYEIQATYYEIASNLLTKNRK